MPRRHRLSICLALVFFSQLLQAQFDSGQISGYVRDASEGIVPECVVVAINEGTREQRQTTTNASGYFVFPNLPVGPYSLTAEVAGFKKSTRTNVTLSSASKVSVDFSLVVGTV